MKTDADEGVLVKPRCRASGVVYSLLLSSSVGNRLPVGTILIIRLCWKAILLLEDRPRLFAFPALLCYAYFMLCLFFIVLLCAFVLSKTLKPFLLFITIILCKNYKSQKRSK